MTIARVLYANGSARWARVDHFTQAELETWLWEQGEFAEWEHVA